MVMQDASSRATKFQARISLVPKSRGVLEPDQASGQTGAAPRAQPHFRHFVHHKAARTLTGFSKRALNANPRHEGFFT
jgi:hypothetical protein